MEPLPSVVLVVPTTKGAARLPDCLDSVARLEYGGSLETIVVDNASSDGTRELLRERYSWVRVLPQERNLGFAEAVNVGAAASDAKLLALANDDMRLDAAWLRLLVEQHRPNERVVCVGGVILDWAGAHVQFADGIVNFHGAAAQVPFGQPIESVSIDDGRDLPFACGGSMLIDRHVFLELGGFDEDYFAYFEDVDLGWRLLLAGYSIRLAGGARCFHRHHATGATLPLERRLRLYETNWLRTLLKNVSDENLPRLLAAALVLVTERARAERAEPTAQARLDAVADVADALPRILERRREVQARRRRPDPEIFTRFGRPFFPAIPDDAYLDTVETVIRTFRLDEVFPHGEPFAAERRRLDGVRGSLARRTARRLRRVARRR